MLLFRHLPGSSWLCCKFWKRKISSPADLDSNADSATNVSADPSSSSSSSGGGSSPGGSSAEGAGRCRHRCRKFYKSLIRRSRTADDLEERRRRSEGAEDQQHLVSGEFATSTEEELKRLVGVISRLLERLTGQPDDIPALGDEECVICTTSRASMQTFPCGHKVLCKTCFVRTIQVALQERQLPLRCVVCRSRVVRLKQQSAPCPVVVLQQREPPGSYYVPQTPSPLPPSGIRRPGYM